MWLSKEKIAFPSRESDTFTEIGIFPIIAVYICTNSGCNLEMKKYSILTGIRARIYVSSRLALARRIPR